MREEAEKTVMDLRKQLQHPLEQYIGKPNDTAPFDAFTVPLDLLGLKEETDSASLNEISAYSAFGEMVTNKRIGVPGVHPKTLMVHGQRAKVVRAAFYKCHSVMKGDLFTQKEVELLSRLNSPDLIKSSSLRVRARAAMLQARPLFAGQFFNPTPQPSLWP